MTETLCTAMKDLPRTGRAGLDAEDGLGMLDAGAIARALVGRTVVEALLADVMEEGNKGVSDARQAAHRRGFR
jgi:hypothetical protein